MTTTRDLVPAIRSILPLALALALAAAPAHATFVEFPAGEKPPGMLEYPLGDSLVELIISHPFRMIFAQVRKFSGSLRFNPENLRAGIAIKAGGLVKDATLEPSFAGAWLAREVAGRRAGREPAWSYEASVVDVVTATAGSASLRLMGDLSLNDRRGSVVVPLVCVVENEFWKCTGELAFRFSAFALPQPRLIGVGPHDEMLVKVELIFGKRES